MSNKANDSYLVNAGAGFSYLARIKLHNGSNATQATINSITRTITNTRTGVAVTDAVTVASVIYDTLQTNTDLWNQTFNMLDPIPASKVPDRVKYLLQYTITPSAGEVIKTRELDIEGD